MSIDEKIRESIKDIEIPMPIFDLYLFNVLFMIWKKPELYVELVETEPYRLDGEIPIIMIKIAWFEASFENKRLYKFLYKRKHGFGPLGLE